MTTNTDPCKYEQANDADWYNTKPWRPWGGGAPSFQNYTCEPGARPSEHMRAPLRTPPHPGVFGYLMVWRSHLLFVPSYWAFPWLGGGGARPWPRGAGGQ